jgi:hypothetical protein
VNCPDSELREIRTDAEAADALVICPDLSRVPDGDALVQRLHQEFRVPWPISGLDAVVSVLADLEWLGHEEAGYLIVVDLKDVGESVVLQFADLLPQIADRRRSAGSPLLVALLGATSTSELERVLAEQNEILKEDGLRFPAADEHPVPIVFHTR